MEAAVTFGIACILCGVGVGFIICGLRLMNVHI